MKREDIMKDLALWHEHDNGLYGFIDLPYVVRGSFQLDNGAPVYGIGYVSDEFCLFVGEHDIMPFSGISDTELERIYDYITNN